MTWIYSPKDCTATASIANSIKSANIHYTLLRSQLYLKPINQGGRFLWFCFVFLFELVFCKCSQNPAIIYLDSSGSLPVCSDLPVQIFFEEKGFPPFSVNILYLAFVRKRCFSPSRKKEIKIYKHFIELIKSNFSFVLLRIRTFCSLQYLWEGQYYSCKISSSKVFHLAMSTFHGKSIETLRAIPEQKRRDRKGIF